jgi:hypothetical protein
MLCPDADSLYPAHLPRLVVRAVEPQPHVDVPRPIANLVRHIRGRCGVIVHRADEHDLRWGQRGRERWRGRWRWRRLLPAFPSWICRSLGCSHLRVVFCPALPICCQSCQIWDNALEVRVRRTWLISCPSIWKSESWCTCEAPNTCLIVTGRMVAFPFCTMWSGYSPHRHPSSTRSK